jgi:DNA-binding MarR family transcriptional regulator
MSAVPDSFGDLLGLARLHRIQRMRAALLDRGFGDFRRGDGAWVRMVAHAPTPLSELARFVGVSPQAATKAADSLEQRGYLTRRPDTDDRRRVLLEATTRGAEYAAAIDDVIDGLDAELAESVSDKDLAAARRVLAALLAD